MTRPVRLTMHFPRRSRESIQAIEDRALRSLMDERRQARPYGHDLLELKCGHCVIRVRPQPGPVLWRAQECSMCTLREQEMSERYARASERKAPVDSRPVLMLRMKRIGGSRHE